MDVIPVNEDETYTKHLSVLILGWVALTLLVAFLMAVVVLL